jgi:hypothetical protein
VTASSLRRYDWSGLRNRRILTFAGIALVMPGSCVAGFADRSGITSLIGFAVIGISLLLLGTWACPRCARAFARDGSFPYVRPFGSACRHCGLPEFTPDEAAAPPPLPPAAIPAPSLWQSVLTGGLIAGLTPALIGVVFLLSVDHDMKEGAGWIVVAGMLGVPVFVAIGAAGGFLAHLARGRHPVAEADGRASRRARAGWVVAGALCGYTASTLTGRVLPPAGALIEVAAWPIWIWIGGVMGHRVARGVDRGRAALGGLVVMGATYMLLSVAGGVMLHLAGAPVSRRAGLDAAAGIAALILGLVAYRGLSRRPPSPAD